MSIVPTKPKSKNLTRAICEAKVTRRIKIYDGKCPGLFMSASPTAPPSFWLKYTDRNTHKRCSVRVGSYHAELFDVDHARTAVAALRWRIGNGADVAGERRQAMAQQAKLSGKTVDQIITERVTWMSTLVKKADGEMRARIESWEAVERIFDRFVSPRLGRKIASEVTARDIAELSDDIVAGRLGKRSVANARHMRRALSGLFRWAAQPSRGYVTASPCINLEPLDKEPPRTRKLTADEIRTLWHGLDRPDMHWDRRTCLAIKLALVTMLRSVELLHAHRDELIDLAGKFPRIDVAMKRVKRRRVIHQPLSGLAVELINKALGNHAFVFMGRFGDAPLSRSAMANALRGTWRIKDGKKVVKSLGICDMLGLKPFTPHDLRRTAASLMGSLGIARSTIAACLDHAARDDQGGAVPRVTEVYDHDPRLKEKRAALDALAAELRRIVVEPVEAKGVDDEMRLAA
jgi:integrase